MQDAGVPEPLAFHSLKTYLGIAVFPLVWLWLIGLWLVGRNALIPLGMVIFAIVISLPVVLLLAARFVARVEVVGDELRARSLLSTWTAPVVDIVSIAIERDPFMKNKGVIRLRDGRTFKILLYLPAGFTTFAEGVRLRCPWVTFIPRR